MRDGNGAGPDGVAGAIGPGTDGVIGDGDAPVYANDPPARQAKFGEGPPSFERVHEMVDIAVERVRNAAKRQQGNPQWWPRPGADEFRREYRHLIIDVSDAAPRTYGGKRFVKLWAWLQDKNQRKRRGGFPIKLRDQFFERGELRAYFLHLEDRLRGVEEVSPQFASLEK